MRSRLLAVVAVLALPFAIVASPGARADGDLEKLITPFDQQRLDRFDATRAAALEVAHKDGAAADIAVLEQAFDGEPLPFDEAFKATGSWNCRTIKLGKLLPLVVYPWFKCKITDDGGGWVLRKVSGSQRTSGRLYTENDSRLVYLGAGTVNNDPVRKYNDDPSFNEVAIVERLGKRRLVFQFPEPQLESLFDILVLER